MKRSFPELIFVTGTDTDVGKTVVSAILTLGLSAHYWKPVQSGACTADFAVQHRHGPQCSDSDFIRSLGVDSARVLPERHKLSRPLSPHLAAELEGKNILLEDFNLPDRNAMQHLIIEGAGGLLVPLNEQHKMIDLISRFAAPVLLVSRSGLGCINHCLLSLEALAMRGIDVFAVAMVGEPNRENQRAIERFGKTEVIAQIPPLPALDRDTLIKCFVENFQEGSKYGVPR